MANETATDDSVVPAELDPVAVHAPAARSVNDLGFTSDQPLQGCNGNKDTRLHTCQDFALAMLSKLLPILCGGAIGFITATEPVFAHDVYATPIRLAQATSMGSSSNLPDVKATVQQAAKLQAEGKFSEASAIWKQLLAIAEKAHGPDHPDVATTINGLAGLLMEQGKFAAAEPLYRRSLAIYEMALGKDHPYVAISLNNLAKNLEAQVQYATAEPLYRRSLAIHEKALGLDHIYVATSLGNLAELLRKQGQYATAEPLYRRSLAIYEKELGANHPNVATSLGNLAELLRKQGHYATAEPIYRRSLAIREKILGQKHPNVADSINGLAGLLMEQGKFAEAERLYRRSLAIYEKALGQNHPDVATSFNNLAGLLMEQGKYAEAERLYRRSLAIYEKALGQNHPNVATSLGNLAELLRKQGHYATAELLFRGSLAIYETALGPNHPKVATTINGLAGVLEDQGGYAAAEPLYRRSLTIREIALGPDHPNVAASLNNLAGLLMQQGQYSAAEPLYRRSLAIREKVLDQDHPDVAQSLGNLAELLGRQGQYAAAEHLYRRSLAIREKVLDPENSYIAINLNNLAVLLVAQGKYAEAERLCHRSLAIYEKALGQNHPNVATSLGNLAGLLREQGQYATAELLFRRSLAIHEKALGPNHPSVATTINGLAGILEDKGQYAAAASLYRRSLSIQENVLGSGHPDVAATLNNLVAVLHGQGQYSGSMPILRRSSNIEWMWLLRELSLLPDQKRRAQLRQLGRSWEFTFGLITLYPAATELSLQVRLNRQGLLPEIEQRQALLLNASGVDRTKVEQLQALTQQLASISLPSDRRTAVREQRDKLQVEIYRQIPELQLQLITTAEVAKALPADGVLVEFQRYQPFDGRKPKDQRWGAAQYIALVLRPNGGISAVPLGPAAKIDALVYKALGASANELSDAEAIWSQLSTLVLKPLLPKLTSSRQWFLSPDGELNRVPFAALPSPQDSSKPLAQVVQLRLLSTGRDLLRLQQPPPVSSAAVVMANPSYDRSGAVPAPAVKPNAVVAVAQQRSADLGSSQWKPLPASEREGQQVASLLGTRLISGGAATSTALQRQQGPRVLHIATHGFFVADQEAKPTDPMRAIQADSPLLRSLRQEDPQLRSGLVLAGANQPDLDPTDDGYLTAAEAVNLNLKGTELVVLSACSTGQGDVRTGEGVYGLQRSLTVAGARSTLLSLWKVDDAATAAFMEHFYQRLKAGEGRSDALAAVQEEFRSGKIRSNNGSNWKDPYYWAAWQLVGDWRPIKGL